LTLSFAHVNLSTGAFAHVSAWQGGESMNRQNVQNEKRYITVAAFQRMNGLSYKTVMHMIKTGQVRYISTSGGNYKIDMQSNMMQRNEDYYDDLMETQRLVKALCRQFNVAI
jgi:hypothetical protein